MAVDDLGSFAAKVGKFGKMLDAGPDRDRMLKAIGMRGKADAADALQADIGDMSMSNWRRGRPFDLSSEFELISKDQVEVRPYKRARGPWRVLEDGRRAGSSYDLVQVGRVRKDGTRRGKSRGRNQGETQGKGTWSDALALMDKSAPEIIDQHVKKARREAFD
jgi:hypothetical protein